MSRRFYEEVLGLEVIQHAPIAMTIRHGSNHTYVVVLTNRPKGMHILNHNGLDVGSEEEVRTAYDLLRSVEQEYSLRKISKPARLHGYYAFMFQDMDGNWWESWRISPAAIPGCSITLRTIWPTVRPQGPDRHRKVVAVRRRAV